MLHVHRAEQTARLADGLAAVLATPLADPFASEVVAVPAKGVERWLAQRLSTVLGAGSAGDGICSGVVFPSAGRLVDEALAAARGSDLRDDPWVDPVWPLLEVVDEHLGEPWCRVLAQHLGHGADDHRRGRRWTAAARLAGLFRSYGAHRPQMLRDWADGRDTDGHDPLPEDLIWQAELWRRLRDRLGPSPAERLEDECAALRADPALSDLPERISIFGPTRLHADALAVLGALAEHRDVHLWLPHPSPVLWKRLEGRTAGRRREDDTATLPDHPLLRSLARDVRELQLRLPPHEDEHHEDADRPATLLGRLQADLRDDVPPGAADLDDTLQVHACHGPGRQVEVLRELLLRLFEDDPTLEPRDVLVMCPDVETFAPLISAAFGLGPGPAAPRRRPARAAGRPQPAPDQPAARHRGGAARPRAEPGHRQPGARPGGHPGRAAPVRLHRRRARAHPRLGGAVRRAVGHRHRHPASVRAGLGRAEHLAGRARPRPARGDDVRGRAGVARPRAAAGRRRQQRHRPRRPARRAARPARGRADGAERRAPGRALDRHPGRRPRPAHRRPTPPTPGSSRRPARELAEAGEGGAASIRLADVRALMADRLRGRPTRANFRTGNLTVCTLVPMRSVPHRVVVLLGLDDGVFPRTAGMDGDDVLARDPCVGERDVRSEDRQLLLDALMAAGERLVVLYTGADPVSGALRPPAVPLGELLDVVDAMVPGARTDIVTRHPLQPYDVRSFTGTPPPSFDPVSLAGARRSVRPREPEPERRPLGAADRAGRPGGPGRLRRAPGQGLPAAAAAHHAARRGRRGRRRARRPPSTACRSGRWASACSPPACAAPAPEDARLAEWLRGTLPPRGLGDAGAAAGRRPRRRRWSPPAARCSPRTPRTVDVRLDLGGRELSGTVNGVRDGAVVTVTYSSLSAKHRARALGACAGPGGRGGQRAGDHRRPLARPGAHVDASRRRPTR